jgi:hypothetical protein
VNACVTQTPEISNSALIYLHEDSQVLDRKTPVVVHDLSVPNVVQVPETPDDSRAINRGMLSVPQTLARRTKVRIDAELWVKWHGRRTYKRLRGSSVLLNAPNAEQAELFIQAIHDFAASLNGKWLAAKPESVVKAEEK